ncbi:unnamed protein product [Effrenium voratum]|nr:unnamed protein product [Effrenium voratum]
MDGVLEQCMDTKEQVSNLAAVLKLLEGDMDIIRRENLQLRAAMRERLYPSGHGAGNRSGSEEGAQDGPNRRDERPGMQQIPGEKLSPRTANRGQESLRGPMRAKNRPEEDRRGKRRDSDLRIPGVPEHEEVGCPMPAFARQLGPGSSAASLSGQSGQDWRSPASHPTALSKQWDPFREINDRQDEGDSTGNQGRKGHPDEDAGSTGRGPGDMRGERDPHAGNVPRQDDAAAIQPDPSGRARGISAQSRAAIGEADARAERERLEKEKHEAAFQRAAAQARQAAQDAQEAQQAVQLQEKLAAQREAELQELEKQLIEQRRKNEQLSREAELAKEQNAPAKQAEDRSNRRPEQRLPGSDGRSDSKASAGSRAKSQPDPSEDRRRHSSELRGKSSIPASGHEVDRPPMPAFARQLPASSGESGQEEDGRTRRPGAYSRSGEDGPGARRDWEANAEPWQIRRTQASDLLICPDLDWDAFMELGDSAHVHARGGMSAQSRAAIGEADATWRAKFLWADGQPVPQQLNLAM